jgi:hypothetical protein
MVFSFSDAATALRKMVDGPFVKQQYWAGTLEAFTRMGMAQLVFQHTIFLYIFNHFAKLYDRFKIYQI